ncbi:glycosyltransferase [Candidatus Roizmanbacteria bacterium]|nr:MAG: glycosyltransferase [Candidatus Roizmanbacteria bacterium]
MNNLQKKQLVIVINNIDGGTGTYLKQLYRLQELMPGYKIRTLCIHAPQYRSNDLPNISFFQNDSMQQEKFSLRIVTIQKYFRVAMWLQRQLKSHSPEYIISVDIYCNILVALLYLFPFNNRPKLILTTHINLKENIRHRSSRLLQSILKTLVSNLYNVADKVVAVSSDITKQHITYFGIDKTKCITIPNGVRTVGVSRVRNHTYRLVTAARLVSQKDFSTLISAVKLAAMTIPEIQLFIYGDGPERTKTERMIEENTANDSVVMKGWTQNVLREFDNADVFIFSSHREGFGYVIVEAMSQGLPVISTDTPHGPAEILNKGEFGILVPMKNPKAMSDAIIALCTDAEKYSYYSNKSLQRASFYSEDAMVQAYCHLLQETSK